MKSEVDVVYMDHNQMTYHKDLAQLQQSRLLSSEALFCATQILKPGAPLLLSMLSQDSSPSKSYRSRHGEH